MTDGYYKKDLNRPIGIAILSALYAISAFFSLARFIMGIPIVVIGQTISGFPAQLFYTFMILLNIYLAYGFNKLLKPAWVISIIFTLYGLLETIFLLILLENLNTSKTNEIFSITLQPLYPRSHLSSVNRIGLRLF
ncbi:hypothetical protein METP3_00195 [Methanosarcinales archaeon]|nr:hypothetical protein METP3_00195 [Methanosarcinales archaeon]